MPLAAKNATERVEMLIKITERLTGILDQENDILASRRPLELEELADEKARLAAIYAQEIRQISQNSGLVETAPPELKDRLRAFTESFEEKSRQQKRVLERARRITEGAIKAIADEVAKKREPVTTYGARTGPQFAAPRPANLTLNQVV